MDTEKILPTDLRLNTYFGELNDELHQEVDELQKRQDGDIIDRELEFFSFETIVNFDTIAHHVAENLLERDDDDVTRDALYRAALFAFQAASIIIGERTGFNASAYITHLIENCEDGLAQLITDIHGYLADNPHLDGFIKYYTDQIDEGRDKHAEIELVAGMIFLLIERKEAKHFMDDTRE